jgi:sugar/nucleoside kinase (ribokinase family)
MRPEQEPPDPVDLVVVGHATRDLRPEGGWRLGGTAVFAALAATRLGLRAAIVTAGPPDVLAALAKAAPDIPVAAVPSPEATVFENRYDPAGRRQQYLHSCAAPLDLSTVPASWREAPLALLAPVAQEVDPALASAFPAARVAATPQGWLRRWNAAHLVHPADWQDAARVLPHLTALILSRDDVLPLATDDAPDPDEPARAAEERIAAWAQRVPFVIVTCGAGGADLLANGARERFRAFPVQEVDPTGAGDVFAAAFLCALLRTGDPRAAVRFANCAASFAVEAEGTAGIPTLAQVMARLEATSPR